jgi:peptide deformylase
MKKILPILRHPNPILREKSLPVKADTVSSGAWKEFLANLEATMLEKDGVGLAAPQVGVSQRIIVIRHEKKNIFLINPEIVKKSWARITDEEGCLSVTDEEGRILYGKVERHKKVICRYVDIKGKPQRLEAEEFLARVLQHEIDHLDGILFIDKLKTPELHAIEN